MAFDVPILFLVFNRPETTSKVFQQIKEMQPARLFVAADGPRAGKEGEEEKCEAVRRLIIDGIDWPCQVETLFRFHNLGCGNAVSSAITWFFENVEEGIILEDDTLPDHSFFGFCKTLLEKYRHDDKVKVISGNNFQNGKWRGDGSYYFSAYSHIWGWASWRRAWNEYDITLSNHTEESVSKALDHYFSDNKVKQHWMKVFHKVKSGMIDTWDIQLLYCIWEKRGVTIVPNANMVINIGFGANATHTEITNDNRSSIPLEKMVNLTHPPEKTFNVKADTYTYDEFYAIKSPGILSLISGKIKRVLSGNK